MKRKVFEQPLSFPSKSRRLDGELLQVSTEEPRNIENVVVATDGLETATETERAIVLYSPTNTPFLRSPTSPDFNFIVNSDLVPGLKDVLFRQGNSNKVRPADDTYACLAVVPWVESQFHQASPTEPPTESELMESEDVDMMDTEDYENCGNTQDYNSGNSTFFDENPACLKDSNLIPANSDPWQDQEYRKSIEKRIYLQCSWFGVVHQMSCSCTLVPVKLASALQSNASICLVNIPANLRDTFSR
ncbi:hypothetical protein Dsin_016754 [Dipteronia sinensis]|uniref:Uncharacterized protein n=1 Tax=Dipteronia sinensis TaxID=43782 RepID=A0AAE0E798_9ROSI|nr:hypothetical protein Dsin_016754 [Dipteronia sinensis]